MEKMVAGVNTLCDAVRSTMGPGGNIAWIDQGPYKTPSPTMDGRTVADHACTLMDDPFETNGAKIASQIARQTDAIGGDGTTTSLVVSQSLLRHGITAMINGNHPNHIEKGVSMATRHILSELSRRAVPVSGREDVKRIAGISAHGDDLVATVVADAIEKLGPDGAIKVSHALDQETSLEVIEGAQFAGGMLDAMFKNDERSGLCRMENPLVLVTSVDLTRFQMLHPAVEAAIRANRPLLVVCRSIGKDAMSLLLDNRRQQPMCAVLAPISGRGAVESLEDIAMITGATMVSDATGVSIESINITHLGSATSSFVSQNDTVIFGGAGDKQKVADRVANLKDQIKSSHEPERVAERIRILSGGVGIIKAGGHTSGEVDERVARCVDALSAAKSAIDGGILPGGGVALLRISKSMPDPDESWGEGVAAGWNAMRGAIMEPFMAILLNAGYKPSDVNNMLDGLPDSYGFDVVSGLCVDMVEAGIIDPVKVTSAAVRNSASIIPLILRTGCATLSGE